MRLVQVVIPAGRRQAVLDRLDEEGVDYVVTDETTSREYEAVVSFPLPAAAIEDVLASLRAVGVEEDAYTVVTRAETVVSRNFEALEAAYAEDGNEDRIAREELRSRAAELASPLGTYVTLTVVSAVVATAGLLLNSPATVVGSMVIAPLVGPAMAAAVGTVVDEDALFARGVRMQVLGLGLAVLSAAAFAFGVRYLRLVPPTLDPTGIEQIRERLAPDFLSLAVALGAGAAGAVSLVSGVSTALVGVMIAVALVPPAATVGIGLAYGLPGVALPAGVLALVNGLSINLAALLVLWRAGYRPERLFRRDEARSAALTRASVLLVAIALCSVVLGGVTYDSYTNALDERTVQEVARTELPAEATLLESELETERRALLLRTPTRVVLTVGLASGDEPPPELHGRLDAAMDTALGRDVAVEIRYLSVDRPRQSRRSSAVGTPTDHERRGRSHDGRVSQPA